MPANSNIIGKFACQIRSDETATKTILQAEVVRWVPLALQLTIGHPRLQQLEKRSKDARKAGDGVKAKMWNANRIRLVRALAGQAAALVRPTIKERRQLIDGILTGLFLMNLTLYWQRLYIPGVIMDCVLVWALWEVHQAFAAMECYVYDIIYMSFNGRKFDDPARPMTITENSNE